MNTPRKPFDPELYAQNDDLARQRVIYHLLEWGLNAEYNDDQFGIDLLVYSSDSIVTKSEYGDDKSNRQVLYGIEAEVKRVWRGSEWPSNWDTIQLPERKGKYLSLPFPIEYWVMNAMLTHAMVIPEWAVEQAIPVPVANKYVRSGELFYQIPVDQCQLIELSPVISPIDQEPISLSGGSEQSKEEKK